MKSFDANNLVKLYYRKLINLAFHEQQNSGQKIAQADMIKSAIFFDNLKLQDFPTYMFRTDNQTGLFLKEDITWNGLIGVCADQKEIAKHSGLFRYYNKRAKLIANLISKTMSHEINLILMMYENKVFKKEFKYNYDHIALIDSPSLEVEIHFIRKLINSKLKEIEIVGVDKNYLIFNFKDSKKTRFRILASKVKKKIIEYVEKK